MASFEQYPDLTPPEEEQKPKHGGLKVILASAVVILLVVAVGAGVIIWRNSALSTAHQTDTEALTKSTAGVNDTSFSAVQIDGLPAYGNIYGKTLKQLKKIEGSKLKFNSKLTAARAEDFSAQGITAKQRKSIKYEATASLDGTSGVSAAVGFNKRKKAVAVTYSFDLDALGVAEADFAVYAGDRTVPASVMQAVGFAEDAVASMPLSTQDDSQSLSESDGLRSCTYSGSTGAKLKTVKKTKKVYNKKKHKKVKKIVKHKVQANFMTWEMTQSYRYGSASSATTRTMTVSLW